MAGEEAYAAYVPSDVHLDLVRANVIEELSLEKTRRLANGWTRKIGGIPSYSLLIKILSSIELNSALKD